VPVFLVDDVAETAAYYRDVLGFEIDFLYGEPAIYGSVSHDDAIINLSLSDPPGRRNSAHASGEGNGVDALIIVSEVDEIYEELKASGATIVVDLSSQEYGMREFQIVDYNGYRLAIAEEIEV